MTLGTPAWPVTRTYKEQKKFMRYSPNDPSWKPLEGFLWIANAIVWGVLIIGHIIAPIYYYP